MERRRVLDIATKDVLCVFEDESVKSAIDKMYEKDCRDVVVMSRKSQDFGLLSVNDLIKVRQDESIFNKPISTINYQRTQPLHQDISIKDAFNSLNYTHMPICVVDDTRNLVGIVSYFDILASIDPTMMLEHRQVSEMLVGSAIKHIPQSSSVGNVIDLMRNLLYDCVVLTEGEKAMGIITTKDVVRFFKEDVDLSEPASKHMVSPLETVGFNTTIKEALDFIQEKQFKRLIVADEEGAILGQVTQDELLARIYFRWVDAMRNNQSRLEEVNTVLEKAALKYKTKCTMDSLTGIANREKLELDMTTEIERIRRYQCELFSVIFFDIDNFKSINDKWGHIVGDAVLKRVVKTVNDTLRATDIFARWGGEEFVVMMPHTSLMSAVTVANKLCDGIAKEYIDEIGGNITCSFGVSVYSGEDNVGVLIAKADEAMYNAKKEGKNRVKVVNTIEV
jgi:diguanylate cyclase (GGDEF)-like protein